MVVSNARHLPPDRSMTQAFHIEVGSEGFYCAENQAVLPAMYGTASRCIPVGCRSGGCGVCRVRVLAGEYVTGCMSAAQVTAADHAAGIVLACQLFPRSNLRLEVLDRGGPSPGSTAGGSGLDHHEVLI